MKLNRRAFIKWLSALSGAAVARMVGLIPEVQAVQPKGHSQDELTTSAGSSDVAATAEGELYGGFLLLPEGAPMPDFVQCAPAPVLCQVDGPDDPAARGEVIKFGSIEELKKYVDFPLYVPGSLPSDVSFAGANVIQFLQSGKVFDASINYSATKTGELRIRVRARPIYPRPYPVWAVHSPILHEKETIAPEKVAFLPMPGVMLPSANGYVLNWIEEDVLYTLVTEHGSDREAMVELVSSLSQR